MTWESPHVYTNQWGTPTPDWAGYGSGSLGGPFYLEPTDQSFFQLSPSVGWSRIVGEMDTAPTPHNLKAGQQIAFNHGTGTFSQMPAPSPM